VPRAQPQYFAPLTLDFLAWIEWAKQVRKRRGDLSELVEQCLGVLAAAEDEKSGVSSGVSWASKTGELGANQQNEHIPASPYRCWEIPYFPNFLRVCPHVPQNRLYIPANRFQ